MKDLEAPVLNSDARRVYLGRKEAIFYKSIAKSKVEKTPFCSILSYSIGFEKQLKLNLKAFVHSDWPASIAKINFKKIITKIINLRFWTSQYRVIFWYAAPIIQPKCVT